MKRVIYLLLFLLIASDGWAQDFKSGGQAQNLPEHKNMMVDYSTGIFHYTVPVCNLKSGNYELPISLDYIGKGVKVFDDPGMLGYNWALNTGGVVTRTVRGGIADETRDIGYIWSEFTSSPTEKDCKDVSLRKRDGESDIFTAILKGKKVNFVIHMDKDREIYAEPLVYTNVRIECEMFGISIAGWTITDENGDRYIYKQQELSKDVCYENVSTSNRVYNAEFTSSWYLTKIIPYNSDPIDFIYKPNDIRKENFNISHVGEPIKMTYCYGRPIKEYPFDFDKYAGQFQMYINEAIEYMSEYAIDLSVADAVREADILRDYGYWATNPMGAPVEDNYRVIGMMGGVANASNVSVRLINRLQSLEDYCERIGSYKPLMAANCLSAARQTVERCMREVKDVREKDIDGGSSYYVYSPLLTMIATSDWLVEFKYKNKGDTKSLISIEETDRYKSPISTVLIDSNFSRLNKLSFLDKDGVETSNILFKYYDYYPSLSMYSNLVPDMWGYYQLESKMDASERPNDDIIISQFSLKDITLQNGGKMEISYEKNKARIPKLGDTTIFGGIRIKSLVLKDGTSSRIDTISYNYPKPGETIYSSFSRIENVRYPGFEDDIYLDRVLLKGQRFLGSGNNGLFYPYVTETIQGKGTNAYLYHTPSECNSLMLNGILLGKAIYDAQGDLKQMTKYKYETGEAYNSDYFIRNAKYANDHTLIQVQGSNYFLDGKSLESFYNRQNTPYVNATELYEYNIKPRLNPLIPVSGMAYGQSYGGKTVLKEELEYRFAKGKTNSVDYNDFFMTLEENPFSKTEYYYDNKRSISPNRIEKRGSDGNVYTTICKRVADMNSGVDPVIDKMKQVNLLLPVVKQLTLSNNQVLNDMVYQYTNALPDSSVIVLSEQLMYVPDSPVTYSENAGNDQLFTYGKSNYNSIASYKYDRNNTLFLPIEEDARTQKKSYAYDKNGYLSLDCNGLGGYAASGCNYVGESIGNMRSDVQLLYGEFKAFLGVYDTLKRSIIDDEEFEIYIYSRNHEVIIRYMRAFLELSICPDMDYVKELEAEINKNTIAEFEKQYVAFTNSHPQYRNLVRVCKMLEIVFVHPTYSKKPYMKYAYLVNENFTSNYDYSIHATMIPDSKRFKLYALDGSNSVSCQVTHAGGKTNYVPSIDACSSSSRLKVFDIDLNAYQNVTAIDVPSSGIYIALIPMGTSFEATCYNSDGTIYAKFDQSGKAEYYTYDRARRVIQTSDQYYNKLKESKYNQIINQ